MISVPYEVKKALREGTYKKNYRFKVFDLPSGDGEYVDVVAGWNGGGSEANGLTLSSPGKYKVYSSSPYFTLMFRSGTSYGGIMATDRDPVTGDYYVEHEFTYAPSTIWITYTSADYNVGVFTTYDYTIIDNNTLVSESVSIDERMCSGDTLKFGLCEGSSLEFRYFDHPNIFGKRIQAFVDVEYRENPYDTVGELNSSGAHYRYDVAEAGDYRIYIDADQVSNVVTNGSVSVSHNGPTTYYNMVVKPDGHGEVLLPGLTTIDMIYLWARSGKYAESTVQIYRGSYYSIPIGFFDVKKCSRQASTGIMKVTAYNKLMSEYLDAKANDMLLENADATEIEGGYISVYSILNNVLNGYGIKELTTETVFTNRTAVPTATGTKMSDGSISLSDTAYGQQDHLLQYFYTRITFEEVNRNEYYIFTANSKYLAKALADYLTTDWYYGALWKDKYITGTNKTLYEWLKEGNVGKIRALPHTGPSHSSYVAKVLSDLSNDYTSKAYTELYSFDFLVMGAVQFNSVIDISSIGSGLSSLLRSMDPVGVIGQVTNITDIEKTRLDINELSSLPDVTLRELQSAAFELDCQFGQLSRETDLFSGVELNHSRLYPADTLYPATDLYPDGAALSGFKSMYSQLWADEGNVRKWRYLIITYKGLDGDNNEAEFTLQRTVNADGTDDYNMSDNWLFRNLIWTAQQVGEYADAMVAKMQNNEWFPFEMWCAGLPYLETGDQIEVPLNGEVYKSYILQRQLKGIQNLQDTYINGTLDIF